MQIPIGTTLADAEREVLLATLRHCGGNKRRTAEMLGVSVKTIYNKLVGDSRAVGGAVAHGLAAAERFAGADARVADSLFAAARLSRRIAMIRKLKSGRYRLFSVKKDAKTGRRRNLGTFDSLEAAKQHERDVQYFKHR